MNILIVANHYAACSARYATDAFRRLGHTVKHVGRPFGRDIWGTQVPEEYVWTPDSTDFDTLPDLTVIMDSDPDVLDGRGEGDWVHWIRGRCSIVWGVDNHVRDYRRPYFDAYFLAHKSVSIQPYDEKTFWLPCAYDPVAFPPSPIPWEQREYDVCMIGVMYPKRWELVQAMRAAGLKVLAGTGLVYDAYRDAHHNSRVALVSSFNGDLPIRLFEGAGMGCYVLTDPIKDLGLMDADYPLAFYNSVDEAVKWAKSLQSHPESVDFSVRWASNHTWDIRAQVIIDWLEARS